MNPDFQLFESPYSAMLLVLTGTIGQLALWVGTGMTVVAASQEKKSWGYWTYFVPIFGPLYFATKLREKHPLEFWIVLIGSIAFLLSFALFIARAFAAFSPMVLEAGLQ
ncbi:MAG: hypothetical protein KDD62_11950 [Bdellovibrionales bacterium]|nr:hypothetical protein [Bdellovibrionales bacterium]